MDVIRKFLNSFRIDRCSWAPEQVPERLPAGGLWIVFSFFFGLYSLLGWLFMRLGCFSHVDIFFGADARWMVGDIAEFTANHYRTNTHPLGVLLVNPVGILLNLILHSSQTTTVFLTALTGSGFVVLLTVFLLQIGSSKKLAFLCASLGGLSACNLMWSAIPDYFLLDGLSLLFFCWVVTVHPRKLWLVLASAVIAAGAVTTSLPAVAMIYIAARHGVRQKPLILLKDGAKFFVLILGLITLLAVMQNIIYPSSTLFFQPHALQSRTMFMYSESLGRRLALLVPYIFLFNIIFPNVTTVPLGEAGMTGIRFPGQLSSFTELFQPAGWLFTVLWCALLGFSLFIFIRAQGQLRQLRILLLLYLLFNTVLHLFYGRPDEFFLYTPHWTFVIIVLLGMSLNYIARKLKKISPVITGYLLLLTFLLMLNNMAVICSMFNLLE